MSQDKPLFEVEVQPPTPEEIERQRVREEYRAKLADKLKDPEFRKIEGFPIGTDEAILALSDPPYYTACPNPFIGEWLKEHSKPFDPDTDDYHREPFAADVSEGKNHPIYNAHAYHTKVPHRAIMRYILHYTEPGDVVFDGFCGTGMTGVAAQLCADRDEVMALGYRVAEDGFIWEKRSWEAKQAIEAGKANPYPFLTEPKPIGKAGGRNAVLNDLSTAASFIASNYNIPVSPNAFDWRIKSVLSAVQAEWGWMYKALHREPNKWSDEEWRTFVKTTATAISKLKTSDEAREYIANLTTRTALGNVNHLLWSDVFLCPHCSGDVVFWSVALDRAASKVLDRFECPHCKTTLTKQACERKFVQLFDQNLATTIRQAQSVPVLVNYSIGKKRHEKLTDEFDVAIVALCDRLENPFWFPTDRMPDGQESRRNDPSGLTHVHHFFSKQANIALAAIWNGLNAKTRIDSACRLAHTAANNYCSRLRRFRPDKKGGGPLAGTLYVSSLITPPNVIDCVGRNAEDIEQAFNSMTWTPNTVRVSCGSATAQVVNPNSIDYIFTDPPFGGNLNYSELSFLWEAWLEVVTNNKPEAITNAVQKKALAEYQGLMQRCFEQCYVGLKPGRWMTVEFHNSANSVWNAIQESLELVGFVVADVRVLDKSQYSFKQVNSSGATKQDLVISCYKPTARFIERFEKDKGTPQGVREFIEQHLEMLPVAPTTSTGNLESLAERTLGVLFDRMIAYHLVRGARIPLSASEFRVLLEDLCYERDGMYFLPSQVVRYDALKSRGIEVEQLSIFVRDEKSAVQWVRNELEREPHTLGELTPKFMQASQDWGQHEVMPELRDLLQQYFIREDDETWVVPDPDNEKHLEEVRRKAMLREFMEYVRRPGQLKLFRTEAVLAGFAHCWETKQYDVIVGVCEKIPPKVLQEIQDLVMFYDIAKERAPEKITQFEFKWE